MLVTIIPSDNLVTVDGDVRSIDCSSVVAEIHAVQWYETSGEVEYVKGQNINPRANDTIDDFSPYQPFVDAHAEEVARVNDLLMQQPYPSWTFNYETENWEPPKQKPPLADGQTATWDEAAQKWVVS